MIKLTATTTTTASRNIMFASSLSTYQQHIYLSTIQHVFHPLQKDSICLLSGNIQTPAKLIIRNFLI